MPRECRVIAVAGLKGGVGKTTVGVTLATVAAAAGQSVLIIDADPQQSATHWYGEVAERSETPLPDVPPQPNMPSVVFVQPTAIAATIKKQAASHDLIVIDLPARLGPETRKALLATGESGGVALLPLTSGGVDVRATVETATLVREAQDFAPRLLAAVVRNRWQPRRKVTADIDKHLSELELPILRTILHERTAYNRALTYGLSLAQTEDETALQEAMALLEEVLGLEPKEDDQ